MKQIYLTAVLFMALFSFNTAQAQVCPDNGFTNTTSLFFIYESVLVDCADRPTTISVDGSSFTLSFCDSSLSIYDLDAGEDAITDTTTFTANLGSAACQYLNGDLTSETLSLESIDSALNGFKVFPNPIAQGQDIQVAFGARLDAQISLYAVTGKRILSKTISNVSRTAVSTANLANGIYVLQVKSGSSTVSKKVVVMN
ncbi:T9SS type A sorting domain-containing protein [Bizionia sp. KMM 8389]